MLLLGQPLPARPAGRACRSTGQGLLAELPAGCRPSCSSAGPTCARPSSSCSAANANIGAARAAFFPRITLTGSVGVASEELGGLFKTDRRLAVRAAASRCRSSTPGATRPTWKSARRNRDIAVAQYEKAIQTAFREVADALAGRATLGEQLRAQQAQAQAEETRYRLADLRYRNGASSYLDVLDAQRSLFVAQQAWCSRRRSRCRTW